jgi:hypothetical protein
LKIVKIGVDLGWLASQQLEQAAIETVAAAGLLQHFFTQFCILGTQRSNKLVMVAPAQNISVAQIYS